MTLSIDEIRKTFVRTGGDGHFIRCASSFTSEESMGILECLDAGLANFAVLGRTEGGCIGLGAESLVYVSEGHRMEILYKEIAGVHHCSANPSVSMKRDGSEAGLRVNFKDETSVVLFVESGRPYFGIANVLQKIVRIYKRH